MKRPLIILLGSLFIIGIIFLFLFTKEQDSNSAKDLSEERLEPLSSIQGVESPSVTTILGIESSPPASLGFNNAEQVVESKTGSWMVFLQGNKLMLAARSDNGEVLDSQVVAQGLFTLPALASEGDLIAVAWVERGATTRVRLALSQDGGETFSAPENLGPGSGPSVDVQNGEVFVTWHDDTQEGESSILLGHFDGDVWQDSVRVDDSNGEPLWASLSVGEEGDLYVVWRDNREGVYRVYLRRSLDGGLSWESEQVLDERKSGDPDICTQGSQVYVAYHQEGEINLVLSNDLGETFGDPQLIDKGWFAHLDCGEELVGVSWEATDKPSFAPGKKAGWALLNSTGELLEWGEVNESEASAATIFLDDQNRQVELIWILTDSENPLSGVLRHAFVAEF